MHEMVLALRTDLLYVFLVLGGYMSLQKNAIESKAKVFEKKHDEKILVVKNEILFPQGPFQGFKSVDFTHYEQLIAQHGQFLWRSSMEVDQSYKQIIPYLVFEYAGTYFLMQRSGSASEIRLRNKFSLGIGGHIRQEDMAHRSIIEWSRREFSEEIDYRGDLTIEPLGLLNDESDDVGKVHAGFVFLLHGASDAIKVRSELKSGKLVSLDQCKMVYDQLESWSTIVFDALVSKAN